MNKRDLQKDIQNFVGPGGFINISQLAKYMRVSRDKITPLVYGLDFFQTGREKKYFIPDVAERILERREA